MTGTSSRAQKPGSPALDARLDEACARSVLGLDDSDLSPRARARLIALLDDIDVMQTEALRLVTRIGELEALADADPLAAVLNRRAFMRELKRALAFAARHEGPVSVLYIDLNGFKAINDVHGHGAGDAAIVHVGAILNESLRETDAVGRLGGDEFAAMLMKAGRADAALKAERLKAALAARPASFEGREIPLAASIGIYETTPEDTPETALAAADAAMYAAKNAPEKDEAEDVGTGEQKIDACSGATGADATDDGREEIGEGGSSS